MAGVVADTHTLVWYVTNRRRLSFRARSALDATANSGDPVFVSAISLVEITYLTEKGRLPKTVVDRIDQELGKADVALASARAGAAGAACRVYPLAEEINASV